MVNLSFTCASFGRISVYLTPDSFVSIGLKIDLTLAGTLSFGSQRYRWLGPPCRYRGMTSLVSTSWNRRPRRVRVVATGRRDKRKAGRPKGAEGYPLVYLFEEGWS